MRSPGRVAPDRRDEHDPAPPGRPHVGKEGLRDPHRAHHVGVVAAVPALGVGRVPVAPVGDAVVVDHDVDAIDGVAHVGHERGRALLGANVTDHRVARAVRVGDRADRVVGLPGLEPVHEDRRALGGEDPRDAGAGAPVRTGDQRHLAVEPEIHAR